MMSQATEKLPFAIKDVEPSLSAEIFQNFYGGKNKAPENFSFVRVGPKNYILPHTYRAVASDIYNMEVRDNDVFVASYPRSGTTWTQELVWMIANDMDYERAKTSLLERYDEIEKRIWLPFDLQLELIKTGARETRYFKTHLPLSLLPPCLMDSAKMVYIARDLRDVAISQYNFYQNLRHYPISCDFKIFWNFFVRNDFFYCPYFECIREAWNMRHHPNILFLFYEELSQDVPATIRRVSMFFGKSYSEEQIQRLAEHLKFSNFQQNNAVNRLRGMRDTFKHIRKGEVGGWREHFDEETTEQAKKWIAENLKDTDMIFPSMENEDF